MAYTGRVRVIWDAVKDYENRRKHGIAFSEAEELFRSGADYLEIFDEANSEFEDRFIAIGPIARGPVLVEWTEREDDVFRIISARWTTRREQTLCHAYMEHQHE